MWLVLKASALYLYIKINGNYIDAVHQTTHPGWKISVTVMISCRCPVPGKSYSADCQKVPSLITMGSEGPWGRDLGTEGKLLQHWLWPFSWLMLPQKV